jgi:hypothetical protein
MPEREERIAENETRFREANEDLRAARERFEIDPPQPTPFICECGDLDCRQIVRLTLDEYERVRANPNTFFVVPGHDDPATEQIVTGDVLDRNERFAVVKKRGEFRDATEGSDPR